MSRKKPLEYKVADLVTEYNQDLFDEVSKKVEIDLEKNIKEGWSAKIENGKARITYRISDYPDASFAHELLHIKYELNGLLPPEIMDNEGVINTLPIIFNQLCHHKFYKEFCDMGFDESEFLNDNDAYEIDYLARRDLPPLENFYSKKGEIQGSVNLLLPYISFLSPHDKSEKTLTHIDRLKKIGNKDFFTKVDTIIGDWVASETLDSSLTLARLFKACNKTNVGFCISGNPADIIMAIDVD